MKGYNRKLAKKILRLYDLAKEVKEILASANNNLVRDFIFVLNNTLALDSIGSFPEDTYNVILANKSRINLGKVTTNTKRCVVIDNRDGRVTYNKENGFLCNKGDISRNSFAVSMSLMFDMYKENNFFDTMPKQAMPIIKEMRDILDEWEDFADKYTHFQLEENIKNFEKNTEYFEAFLGATFKPEIERRKAKHKQREERGKLLDEFLKIRKKYPSNNAVYRHFAKVKLAKDIERYKNSMDIISHAEGLRLKKDLDKKIEQATATIKRAVCRAKEDRKKDNKALQ